MICGNERVVGFVCYSLFCFVILAGFSFLVFLAGFSFLLFVFLACFSIAMLVYHCDAKMKSH